MPYEFDQIPYPLVYEEQAAFKDTYGGAEGVVVCESYLLRPKVESDTVLVFMHPVGGGAYLPMVRHLARSGHHVIYCNSRYRSDVALIMEKVVLDLGACVRDAKERLGYAKVVLAGWSGGGALSLYYQEQAEKPWVTATPAGDSPDLTAAGLVPADAVMLLAAHTSRHGVLTLSLDPSIVDEADPIRMIPSSISTDRTRRPRRTTARGSLRFRDAQVERNRRITAWVKDELEPPRARRGARLRGARDDGGSGDPRRHHRPQRPASGHELPRRSPPREQRTGRPRSLLHVALMALAMEPRRRARRWPASRSRDLGAGARDRQRRGSRVLPEPRNGAVRRGRRTATRSGTRSRARRTTTSGPVSGRSCRKRSMCRPIGSCATTSRPSLR